MKTLDDAADFLSGGTPRKSNPIYWGGSIPWYSASNMNSRYLGDTEVTITTEGLKSGSKIAPAGSTLILVRGSGLFNFVPICFAQKDIAFNQDVKALVPKRGINPTFLHFWIESLRQDLNENIGTTGIGAGKFDTDFLKNLPFPDIDFDEQAIRGIVSSVFDKKIDLLREMNRTLEEMARAVFRAWFVDFLPVRAKAAGATSFRGMPQALFETLPATFTHSELGEIPEGWGIGRVGDVVELVRTSVKPFENPDEVYHHFSLPAFDRDQEPDFDVGSSIKSSKYSIPADAILFSKLNPRIPRVWWPRAGTPDHQRIASTEFLVCVAREDWSRSYAYCLFTQPPFIEGLTKQASGTSNSHQRIKPDQFENVTIPVPPLPLRQAFLEFALPILKRVIESREQRGTLASLRDTLLPKLISGELEAPDLDTLGLTPTDPAEASDGG